MFIDHALAADITDHTRTPSRSSSATASGARAAGDKFREKLLAFQGGSPETVKTNTGDVIKPYWSRVWDHLFDSFNDVGLHSPEVIGKILQQELDLPRWDPPPPPPKPAAP